MASKSRTENTRQWRERVAQSESRKGSLSSYCRAEGISLSGIKYWRRKLGASAPALPIAPKPLRPSGFIPVQVVREPREEPRAARDLPDPRWVAEVLVHLDRLSRSPR